MIRMWTGNEQINQAPTEVLGVVSPLHLNMPFGLLPVSHLHFPLPLYLHLRSPRALEQNPEASQIYSSHAGLHTGFSGIKWNQPYVANLSAFFLKTIVRLQSTGMCSGWLGVKWFLKLCKILGRRSINTYFITAVPMIYFSLQIPLVANSVS